MTPSAPNRASTVFLPSTTIAADTTGDDEEKARLESKVQNLSARDISRLQSYLARSINSVAMSSRDDSQAAAPETARLTNPYEDRAGARQLNETVDEFLSRLPVLTSESVSPWLWIANFTNGKGFDDAHLSSLYPDFIKKSKLLLQEYLEKKDKVQSDHPHLSTGWITRRLSPDRDKLKDAILKTATECKETCGKAGALSKVQAQH
jgi:hypothetical protein